MDEEITAMVQKLIDFVCLNEPSIVGKTISTLFKITSSPLQWVNVKNRGVYPITRFAIKIIRFLLQYLDMDMVDIDDQTKTIASQNNHINITQTHTHNYFNVTSHVINVYGINSGIGNASNWTYLSRIRCQYVW